MNVPLLGHILREASEITCAEGPAASKPCQPTDTYLHDTNPKTKPVQRKAFGRREQARIDIIYTTIPQVVKEHIELEASTV